MLWAERLSQGNSLESRPTRWPPNGEQRAGRFGTRVHDRRSPRADRRRAGAEMEARAFHELLARPRRLIRDGPRHAAISTGQLDEKRMHYGSSRSNRLRTHADESNLMSETQRTTIDTARDNAHTHGRILVSYATEFNAAGANPPNHDGQIEITANRHTRSGPPRSVKSPCAADNLSRSTLAPRRRHPHRPGFASTKPAAVTIFSR